jgi:membrane protein DedA with SNARE-associated domain
LTTQVAHHGYAAVFVLMLLESACVPIPSEVVMLFGGALAGGLFAGANPHVTLVGVALAGAFGNLAGALIAFGVGWFGGQALLDRYGRRLLIRPQHVARSEVFFARRGDQAVLVGRMLPVVRTFISLPAGVAKMPVGRFAVFTLLGSLPWTFALAAVGYAVAANWKTIASDFTYVSIAVGIVLLALIAWWLLRRMGSQADVGASDDRS